MTKPLFVHDFGFVCALGNGCAQKCDCVLEKLKNGVPADFVWQDIAGLKKPAAVIPFEKLSPVRIFKYDNRVNRLSQMALDEIDESVRKMVEIYGADRVGIFLGSCDNGSDVSLEALKVFKETGTFPEGYSLEHQRPDFPIMYIAERYGITGMKSVHSTACASSASALVAARNNIYAGNCDAAIVGGVDIASSSVSIGFSSLESVSENPSNPFSANRSGLTLGDGAVYFLVTKEVCDKLCVQGCEGLKFVGFGESADADHITAPRADGEGAIRSIESALTDAEIRPDDVGYINLHGTGTFLNDRMESIAVHQVFGDSTFASSTKALTGHTLGASGALEAAFCCMALQNNFIPVHHFDGKIDPTCSKIALAKSGDRAEKFRYCISNSFAFGGCNVSLVIGKDC